jgi:chromosome partitioning protein
MLNTPLSADKPEQAPRQNAWGQETARIISFVSQKGGVGKTTSAVNLGAAFALSGHRVLLVGLDPQCGLSRSLGFAPEDLRGGLRDVLTTDIELDAVIHETSLENLHLVSPDAHSLPEEEQSKAALNDHRALENLLDDMILSYDTVLIDCPPGFNAETRAALAISDSYLVPVQAEELCRDSLGRLMTFISEFEPSAGRGLRLEGMFLTMTDNRTRMTRHVSDSLISEYGDVVYESPVPRTTRLAEMALKGRPTVIFDRRSNGSRAYFNLLDEIVLRYLHRDDYVEDMPEPPRARPIEPAACVAEPAEQPSGLARMLEDMGASLSSTIGASPVNGDSCNELPEIAEENEPDLVSLDDLLDEEERAGRSRRDENNWGFDDDALGSVN